VPFPPSGRLVRDLTAIVEIPALPMFHARQDLTFRGTIGPEFIGHDHSGRVAQALQQLAKEALGRLGVAAALDQHVKHVAMLINRSPEVVQFASDADKHFIQKPFVSGLWPAPLEAVGIGPPEAQAPFTDSLVADHDASCGEDQLDFAQAQAEAVIQPDGLVDDFGWEAEAPVRIGRCAHAPDPATDPSPGQPDSTLSTPPGTPEPSKSGKPSLRVIGGGA
jgi:hypothetical protein